MASKNVSNTFTVAGGRGIFWRTSSLNSCDLLYFSDIKWFLEHFEGTTYYELRSLPFYNVATRSFVNCFLRVVKTYRSHLQGKSFTAGNIGNHLLFYAIQHPGKRRPKPHRGGILQSRILGAVLHECGNGYFTLRLSVLLNRVLMSMFKPNREVTSGSRMWHEKEVENFTFHAKTLGWTNIRRWNV